MTTINTSEKIAAGFRRTYLLNISLAAAAALGDHSLGMACDEAEGAIVALCRSRESAGYKRGLEAAEKIALAVYDEDNTTSEAGVIIASRIASLATEGG